MTWVAEVDDAIDVMLATDPTLTSFHRSDIAGVLGTSLDTASQMLSVHRDSQPGGYTRHVLVARGYARGARWFLLSAGGKPGERLSLGHAAYIAADLSRRAQSDIAAELSPAAMRQPGVAMVLNAMAANMERDMVDAVNTVNLVLQLNQATRGTVPDLTNVPV